MVILGALISLPFHAYFIFCYLGKPSLLDPAIPWQDYFAMNDVIRARFAGEPVLAAVQPGEGNVGLEKPVPMEVTTSFSMPYHTAAHVKLNQEQMVWFRRMNRSGETLAYAAPLGYRYTVWGPVEERVWGERNRRRFIDGNPALARTGSVSLHVIRDGLEPLSANAKTEEGGLRLRSSVGAGRAFRRRPWKFTTAWPRPGCRGSAALMELARMEIGAGDFPSALKVTEWILSQEPNHPGAHALRGAALARSGQAFLAIESYRRVLALNAAGCAGTKQSWPPSQSSRATSSAPKSS